jgi:hypothetical protein
MKTETISVKARNLSSRVIASISRRAISKIIKVSNPIIRIKDSETLYTQGIKLIGPVASNESLRIEEKNWNAPAEFFFGSREIISVSNAFVDLKLWNMFVERRKLISESNPWGYEYLMRNPVPRPLAPVVKFENSILGEAVVLSSNGFYHWLIEDLPKTLLLIRASKNPFLVVQENPPSYVRDFVEKSDLRSIELPRFVYFNELKFITTNNSTGWPRPADIEILRDFFQSDHKEVTDNLKVYVPRLGESRSPMFEKKLVSKLESEDWKIFDAAKHSLSEQISVFSSAAQVAGIHGAGLTGATWMAEGTVVHEISPEKNVRCFSRICSINKVRHNRIVYSNQNTDLEYVYKQLAQTTY